MNTKRVYVSALVETELTDDELGKMSPSDLYQLISTDPTADAYECGVLNGD